MKKIVFFLALVVLSSVSAFAQVAQVSFSSSTNFTNVVNGFHPISFKIKESSSVNVDELKRYALDNPKFCQVEVVGNDVNLRFVENIHWGIWMKIFVSMNVSQIEIVESPNESVVVEPMDFLRYFHLLSN